MTCAVKRLRCFGIAVEHQTASAVAAQEGVHVQNSGASAGGEGGTCERTAEPNRVFIAHPAKIACRTGQITCLFSFNCFWSVFVVPIFTPPSPRHYSITLSPPGGANSPSVLTAVTLIERYTAWARQDLDFAVLTSGGNLDTPWPSWYLSSSSVSL